MSLTECMPQHLDKEWEAANGEGKLSIGGEYALGWSGRSPPPLLREIIWQHPEHSENTPGLLSERLNQLRDSSFGVVVFAPNPGKQERFDVQSKFRISLRAPRLAFSFP